MTSEWDNTPWAGSPVHEPIKAISRLRPVTIKAVSGGNAYYTDLPITMSDPQSKAASFLRAYKCGWFNKAGRKISGDFARLGWSLSDGDAESDDLEKELPRPDLDIPFASLSPIDQLQRLLEKPNPSYSGSTLFQKTLIRYDFGGVGFWYLENGAGGALPTAIYGISPGRLWPARDRQGQLIGWVLDRDSPNPVPFAADEIIAFSAPSAGDGDESIFGVGVVEAVYAELPLTDLIARHTTDLLSTGGRLAGMISPKDRALTEDEFEDAVRVWRSVASDPNAARRLLLFPEPMEYTAGASTPAEIGIPELAALNRDSILTAFPISPHALGVPHPSGLNASGEVRREERRDYWSDTMAPRVDTFKSVIQSELVSRYEAAMGQTFDFDIPIPNLDDAPTLIEKVGAYKGLVSIGLDPKESLKAVELDHIRWLGLPAILDPAQQLQMQQAAQEAAVTVTAGDTTRRDAANTQVTVAKAIEPHGESVLRDFFAAQRERIAQAVRDTLPKSKAARKADLPDDWWNQSAEDAALREALHALYVSVGREGLQVVADKIGRVVLSPAVKRIVADLLEYGGARITDINQRTKDAVTAQLIEGTRRGYSIEQLVEGVPDESYAGVKNALLDNGIAAFDSYRAEMIARTETALSYNRASIRGYGEFGVREVQAIDGDGDAECASRAGRTFSVDEALGITDHPNGTLDWIPVIPQRN